MGIKSISKLLIATCLVQSSLLTMSQAQTLVLDDGGSNVKPMPSLNHHEPSATPTIDITLPAEPAKPKPKPSPKIVNPAVVTSKPTSMTGVSESMVKGATCPLVDNRPYADLKAAVDNLYQNINPVAECQNDVSLEQLQKSLKAMLSSATIAQSYWSNPEKNMQLKPGADPADPTSYDDQYMDENLLNYSNAVTSTLTHLNSVATTVTDNAFVKSSCGKQLLSFSGIVKSLGDVATSISPMALLAAAANPANKPLMAAVLGVSTFGAVSQVIKQLVNAGVFDMNKPENRLILLQNTCEFSKIAERVRYLKLAQAGQIKQVSDEIALIKETSEKNLRKNMSNRLQLVLDVRDNTKSSLNQADSLRKIDTTKYNKVIAPQLKSFTSDFQVCISASTYAKNAEANSFPVQALNNYKNLIERQQSVLEHQSVLLKIEEYGRQSLLSMTNGASINFEECAKVGRAYMETIGTILKDTDATIKALRASLRTTIANDEEGGPFQQEEEKITQQNSDISKVLSIVERLREDNSAPDKAEMNAQLALLKQALFSETSASAWTLFLGPSTPSPAYGWLTFMDEEQSRALARMTSEWNELRNGSCRLTKSKCQAPVIYRKESLGLNAYERQAYTQYFADVKVADSLSNINATIAPVGSDQNLRICRKLENVYLEWISVWDFLGAQSLFCNVIEPLFDTSVQKDILRHCLNDKLFNGEIVKKSAIENRISEIKTKGYNDKAQLLTQKMEELSCAVNPDPGSAPAKN